MRRNHRSLWLLAVFALVAFKTRGRLRRRLHRRGSRHATEGT